MTPTVSVIVPCYNHARFVERAIESVCAQTAPAHEVVIINDGSTDGSAAVIDTLAARYPGFVRAFHQVNRGPAWTRQQAVERATGTWVLPLDADDYLHPTAIEHMTDYALRNPDYVVIYSDYFRVDETDQIISEYRVREFRDDPLEGQILNTLVRQSSVTATALIQRDKILEVGGYYSEDTANAGRGHEDYFVYLKLALKGYAFGYVPESLFYYRVTAGSISSRNSAFYQNRLAVLKHVYKLDSDRMVEAEDYATFRRVDQLEDAFLTLRVRNDEIADLQQRIASLQTRLDQAQNLLHMHNIPLVAVHPTVAPTPTGGAEPARAEDIRAQLDELRRLKASKFYWLLYRVIDPTIARIRRLFTK